MKRPSRLTLTALALLSCSLLDSCIYRGCWNNVNPEKTVEYYVKSGDLVKGQYVYKDSQGYYVLMERRRLNNGRYECYAFPVAWSIRDKQGSYTYYETVRIPTSFANYLLGGDGSATPEWLDARPDLLVADLESCGKIVRLPKASVSAKYSLTKNKTDPNAMFSYVLLGWAFDVTGSAIGTAFCAAGAPLYLLVNPSGFFSMDSEPEDTPDSRFVPAEKVEQHTPVELKPSSEHESKPALPSIAPVAAPVTKPAESASKPAMPRLIVPDPPKPRVNKLDA